MGSGLPKVVRRRRRGDSAVLVLSVAVAVLLGVIVYLFVGGDLLDRQLDSDAERDYLLLVEAVKANPSDPESLMRLAETEWQLGRRTEALRHARDAVKHAGDLPRYRLRYGQLLLLSGDLQAARSWIDEEVQLSRGNDPEALFVRAQLERTEKRYERAIADMERGLKLAPEAADMVILYGDILAEAGRIDDAIEQYQRALRFLPNDERALEGLERLGVRGAIGSTRTGDAGGSDARP